MLNTIEELIEDIAQGKMVVVMDDEDRENEGDLIMAGVKTRPEDINFMARYARGLICLTLTRERCHQLRLPLMVDQNQSGHGTNFTVSIEAATGVTTGISAADRARTVLAAVKADAKAEDIVQPGHIFPLMAQPGGVLARAGHTEAGCDLARLAGLEPTATIVEVMNDDGTMARRPDLERFAAEHNLKIGTIADLIRYRIENERTVERISECDLDTVNGSFRVLAYQDSVDQGLHFALVKGDIASDSPVTVRVHVEEFMADTLGAKYAGEWPLSEAMQHVGTEEGPGVVIVLRPQSDNSALVRRLERMRLNQSPEAFSADDRTSGVGAQILSDIGVQKMRLMTAPKVYHGLSGYGLEIVEFITR